MGLREFVELFDKNEVKNLFNALSLCIEYVRIDLHVFNIGAYVTCLYSNVNDRDLLAANNIKRFGLEKQNLLTQENINKTPVVNREGDVELSAAVGAMKRQNVLV